MLTAIIIVSVLFQVLGAILANAKFGKRHFIHYEPRVRPITIIKPVKGLDGSLAICIASFLRLPFFDGDEIIFCFESVKDEAYALVERMTKDNPRCRITTSGYLRRVENPKINNIWEAFETAKNNLILISDQNVIASEHYLQIMDHEFEFPSGILTNVCSSSGGGLDATMLNTFNAKWILILNFLGASTVVGKSMMFDRRVFNRISSLNEVGEYIAEDYAFGKVYQKAGRFIEISSLSIRQSVARGGFWSRYMRWGVMRKAHAPIPFLIEPLFYGVVTQFLTVYKFGFIAGCLFAIIWINCDITICDSVSNGPLFFPSYLFREWLAIPLWFKTIFTRTINWKGRDYVVSYGGKGDLQR